MGDAPTFEEQHPNLAEWVEALSAMLGVDAGALDASAVLAACDAAGSGVGAAASPLTAYLLGLAATGTNPAAVQRAASQAAMLARAWPADHSESDLLGEWLD